MDLKEKESSYANLVILQIKRNLDNTMIKHKDYSNWEIINIALDILRIMSEISYGAKYYDEGTEKQWQLFFDAQKTENGLLFLMQDLYRQSTVKNKLINEILNTTEGKDLMKLLKENLGDE